MKKNIRNRDENKAIIKKVNRVSKGRKKPGIDGVKLVVIMITMMVVIAGFLIFIGNFSLPESWLPTPNANEPEPTPTTAPPEEVLVPFIFPEVDEDMLFFPRRGGRLELPVTGATGWVAANTALREAANVTSQRLADLVAGLAFTILSESGDWWYVRLSDGETTGWVDKRRCFINLPDVLPSIIYSVSNASASLFRSSGFDLPNVTGYPLYSAKTFNERLGRDEYIVPGLYLLARALFVVQQNALENGDTLVIYEVYRPMSAQKTVLDAMNELKRNNTTVNAAFADSYWNLTWYISSGVSNHQRGAAVDASLARIRDMEIKQTGDYSFFHISRYTEIYTKTQIHELSPASAITDFPRSIMARQIINESIETTDAVTPGIKRMQNYFALAGFNLLASEWWHFDHQPSVNTASSAGITGEFYTETIYSEPPVR